MASLAAIAGSWPGESSLWRKQVSLLAISANIAWILSGIVGHTLILIWMGVAKGWAERIPADTLGTVVLTIFSVALAWASAHWSKRELAWLVYGFMGLGAWKLATRDFVNERSLALVISLLFYGGALLLLPRMLRKASQLTAPDSVSSPSAI
jgi:MFS superfamily sulfate permease-like transporter